MTTPVVVPAAATTTPLPALNGFDPTRVRLTGLRAAEWPDEAACAGLADRDLDPWHPDGDMRAVDRRAAADLAREVCATCPVKAQCLALGLALLPLGGVWGIYAGLTPNELRAVAKARGLASQRVAQHGTRARRVAGCDCPPCKRAHAEYVAQLRAEDKWAGGGKRARREAPVGAVVAASTWGALTGPVDLDTLDVEALVGEPT